MNVLKRKSYGERLDLLHGKLGAWEIQNSDDKDVRYRIMTSYRNKLETDLSTLPDIRQAFLDLAAMTFKVLRNAKYQKD